MHDYDGHREHLEQFVKDRELCGHAGVGVACDSCVEDIEGDIRYIYDLFRREPSENAKELIEILKCLEILYKIFLPFA